MVIKLSRIHFFHLWIDYGTNTKAMLLAMWGLCFFVAHKNLLTFQVVGESRIISDWITGKEGL